MFVKTEEGTYSFTSTGSAIDICGLYVISEPDHVVEFEFDDFDVSCPGGGLLSVVDGWELNGQFFPGTQDHPIPRHQRYHEFCGAAKPWKAFRMSQNVGLLEFRIPARGEGFTVRVRFHENPKRKNFQIPLRFLQNSKLKNSSVRVRFLENPKHKNLGKKLTVRQHYVTATLQYSNSYY